MIYVIPARTEADCAIACIAMLCGVDYEVAACALPYDTPKNGARMRDVVTAARRFGILLRWTRCFEALDDATGILCVRLLDRMPDEHLVVLFKGLVVETDQTLWDLDTYLVNQHATIVSFLQWFI